MTVFKGFSSLVVICLWMLLYVAFFELQHVERQDSVERILVKPSVHIIGKAAIADYLWQHILEGSVNSTSNGFFKTGTKETDIFTFEYLSGPGFIQTTIPQDIQFVIFVLNGRSPDKRRRAIEWLNYLYSLPYLKKAAIILLGDERCRNSWILKYMKIYGGVVDVLFVVYDWKYVDNNHIYQWPLGVASYRGFPLIGDVEINYRSRQFRCNFMGTVYSNSSRSLLQSVIDDENFPHSCFTLSRYRWLESETEESLRQYMEILNDSDFTLCPVGKNAECYRIYEALSYGSIPIIEDVSTGGDCASPFQLLKQFEAPVVYIKNWNLINATLNDLNLKYINVRRLRHRNILWYKQFKLMMRNRFISILKTKFFY